MRRSKAVWLATGTVLVAGALWLLPMTSDPYAHEIDRDWTTWRGDDGLQRAIAELEARDRQLLMLWLSRYHSGPDGALEARTVREAIDEIRRVARTDPRLAATIELYSKQPSAPDERRFVAGPPAPRPAR